MCCCRCIKALCVKIIYIALLVITLGVGLMFSFDLYISSSVFEKSHYRDAEPYIYPTGNVSVAVKSGLLGVTYYKYNYNINTKCLNTEQSSSKALGTFYMADDSFTVYGETVEDGKTVTDELEVLCA